MTTYKGDLKGIRRMLTSGFIEAAVMAHAMKIKNAAEYLAPVGSAADGDEHPGTFKNSFVLRKRFQPSTHYPGGGRTVVDVISTDPLGYVKEMGHIRRVRVTARARDDFEASLLGDFPGAATERGSTFVDGSHTLKRAMTLGSL